jgi:hypothetical protein
MKISQFLEGKRGLLESQLRGMPINSKKERAPDMDFSAKSDSHHECTPTARGHCNCKFKQQTDQEGFGVRLTRSQFADGLSYSKTKLEELYRSGFFDPKPKKKVALPAQKKEDVDFLVRFS